jgi:beta-N-acetylhexosaminidase
MACHGHPAASTPFRRAPGWLAVLSLTACGGSNVVTEPAPEPMPVEVPAADTAAAVPAIVDIPPDTLRPEPVLEPLPEPVLEDTRPWAERTLDDLTLREKVGQMIMPWVIGDFAPVGSSSHNRMVGYVEEEAIGGVIMSVGSPTEVAAKINGLQRRAKVPLLVAADLETGAGFRMRGAVFMPGTIELGGATSFPSLMALGATGEPSLAYEMGRVTAVEAAAVGIRVPFAPVLDVNNNPDNPIINVRSFGEDPEQVAEMGAAFVRGIQDQGAIATGKHFPGHGDTDTDSHLRLPVINATRERMDSVELRPFQAAIDVGMGAMMTAHITVPSINGGNGEPATLSSAVLTDLLRTEMAFEGLIVTDAMDMSAISGRLGVGEASVRAVEAGADVILMPASVGGAAAGIVSAVEEGRVPEGRIDDSVLRILQAKEALGLPEKRTVDLEAIPSSMGTPEHLAVAEEIAEKSITLITNGGGLLPLRGTRSARVLSVTYRRPSDVLAGRYFNRRLRQTYPRLVTANVDQNTAGALSEGLIRQARNSALVVVSIYVTAVSYSNSVAVPDEVADFVRQLDAIGKPHVVVSFGNPYLITDFPDVRAYMLGWSGSEVSQRAAARALFGEFDIRGRTPTRIPGFAEIGDGIVVPRKTATGSR